MSSVKKLEDAKVARGCMYIAMPVQEVGVFDSRCPHTTQFSLTSMGRCNSVDSKRSRRRDTTPLWPSSRSSTQRDVCRRLSWAKQPNRQRGRRGDAVLAVTRSRIYPIDIWYAPFPMGEDQTDGICAQIVANSIQCMDLKGRYNGRSRTSRTS